MEGDYPSILSEWMEKGTARRFISDTNLSVDNVLSMVRIQVYYPKSDIDYYSSWELRKVSTTYTIMA